MSVDADCITHVLAQRWMANVIASRPAVFDTELFSQALKPNSRGGSRRLRPARNVQEVQKVLKLDVQWRKFLDLQAQRELNQATGKPAPPPRVCLRCSEAKGSAAHQLLPLQYCSMCNSTHPSPGSTRIDKKANSAPCRSMHRPLKRLVRSAAMMFALPGHAHAHAHEARQELRCRVSRKQMMQSAAQCAQLVHGYIDHHATHWHGPQS